MSKTSITPNVHQSFNIHLNLRSKLSFNQIFILNNSRDFTNIIICPIYNFSIFINISLYLREDIIHVRLVVATALMAIARKVIIFDFKELSYQYVYAAAAVLLALGITYWLLSRKVPLKLE